MQSRARSVDAELLEWADIGLEPSECALLLGNGASMAVWKKFDYPSLYERAQWEDVEHRLATEDLAIFDSLATRNFEQVLHALMISGRINQILRLNTREIKERYQHIRQSLVDAVCAVHLPWESMMPDILNNLGSALIDYDTIFSTNYDLLVYWSLMRYKQKGFKDYFWKEKFNIDNTELYDKCCRVLFLHGALHLYIDAEGNTWKRRNDGVFNLLELFRMPRGSRRTTPLFITEGNARQKLRSIQESDYLHFVYRELEENDKSLVVFGHGLSEEDLHIINAINKSIRKDFKKGKKKEIAFGIYEDDPNKIMQQKLRLEARLSGAKRTFFKSSSHPLGAADLRIGVS